MIWQRSVRPVIQPQPVSIRHNCRRLGRPDPALSGACRPVPLLLKTGSGWPNRTDAKGYQGCWMVAARAGWLPLRRRQR